MPPKLFQHQIDALSKSFNKPAFAYFCEQGTGKSAMIIHEAANLFSKGQINCIVIISPNGLQETWADQFETHAPESFLLAATIQIYKSGNIERQENVTRAILTSGKCLVFLINIEAISTATGFKYLIRLLLARRAAYLAIDESHKIKNPAAIRTKNAIKLGGMAKYRRIATGTEAEEGIHELYSQMKFLDSAIVGHKSFTSFRGMFCVMGGYENREIKGYVNQDVLAQRIAPYTFQIRKRDCLDLPATMYVKHYVELTKEQRAMYDILKDELLLELDNGTIVDVSIAMNMLLRLQQVLCGHLMEQDVPSNRAKYISELVESIPGKSIIFCRFRRDVTLMTDELIKNRIRAVGFSGDSDVKQRADAINSWREARDVKALVMTAATGGVGLTLNEANQMIFYSNSWSATERYQAEARNHRIGQEDKVTYHDVVAKGLLDDRLLAVLRGKQKSSMLFRSMVEVRSMLL